jgi:hypothetical protein
MSFRMVRIFCATPGDSEDDLEAERQAFHEVVGQLNEAEEMPPGILLVPVSVLPHLANMIFFQQSIDENVYACTFFVQLLHHTWGPATRNFERVYRLATECCADPRFPMKGVSLFLKAPDGRQIEPGVAWLRESVSAKHFGSLDELKTDLRSQLSVWLKDLESDAAIASTAAR